MIYGFTIDMIDILSIPMLERLFLCSDNILIRNFMKFAASSDCPSSIRDKINKGLIPYKKKQEYIRIRDKSDDSIYRINERMFYDEYNTEFGISKEELEKMLVVIGEYESSALDEKGKSTLLSMTPAEARKQLFDSLKSALVMPGISEEDKTIIMRIVEVLNTDKNITTLSQASQPNNGLTNVANNPVRFSKLRAAIKFRLKIINEQIPDSVWRRF